MSDGSINELADTAQEAADRDLRAAIYEALTILPGGRPTEIVLTVEALSRLRVSRSYPSRQNAEHAPSTARS